MKNSSLEKSLENFKRLYIAYEEINNPYQVVSDSVDNFLKNTTYDISIAKIIFRDLLEVLDEYKTNTKELKGTPELTIIKDVNFQGQLEDLGATFYRNASENKYFNVFEAMLLAYNPKLNMYKTPPNIYPKETSQDIKVLQDSIISFRRQMHRYNTTARAKYYWQNIKNSVDKNEKIKEETAQLYSSAGVSSFAVTYANIADDEKCAKYWWLFSTAIFTALVVIPSISSLYQILFTEFQHSDIIFRLPYTLFFLIAALWTGNKYNQSRRNHLIYRHLASTLSTYKAFEASVSDEHKSLLLFEISKVLFPPPVDNRSENQKELSNMIDLIKAFNIQGIIRSNNIKD